MKINNRQQLLVILAAVGVALLLGDKLVLSPLTTSWKERSDRIVELRKSVAQGKAMLDRGAALQRRWDNMRTNTLSTEISVAEQQILKAFDRWSQDSRISITSIKPQWKRTSEDYMTLECRVDASGNLSTISRFLYNVEKDPLAVKVDALELNSKDNNGNEISLALQVSGLVLQSQEK